MSSTPETPRRNLNRFNRETNWPNSWPKIVLLGDSLIEFSFDREGGYGAMLASRFRRQADIVNRGFSGYNTRLILRALPRIFDRTLLESTACLILCIGANDSWDRVAEHNFNPHVPVSEYVKNLKSIINWLQQKGLDKEKIIMLSPPTIDADKWKNYSGVDDGLPIYKTHEQTRTYVDAMIRLGLEINVQTLDAFRLTSQTEHKDHVFMDGLHYSTYGANLIFDLLRQHVEKRVNTYRYGTSAGLVSFRSGSEQIGQTESPAHIARSLDQERISQTVRVPDMDVDNNLPNYNEIDHNDLDKYSAYFNNP